MVISFFRFLFHSCIICITYPSRNHSWSINYPWHTGWGLRSIAFKRSFAIKKWLNSWFIVDISRVKRVKLWSTQLVQDFFYPPDSPIFAWWLHHVLCQDLAPLMELKAACNKATGWDAIGYNFSRSILDRYPLVNIQKAMEISTSRGKSIIHGPFSIAILVYPEDRN